MEPSHELVPLVDSFVDLAWAGMGFIVLPVLQFPLKLVSKLLLSEAPQTDLKTLEREDPVRVRSVRFRGAMAFIPLLSAFGLLVLDRLDVLSQSVARPWSVFAIFVAIAISARSVMGHDAVLVSGNLASGECILAENVPRWKRGVYLACLAVQHIGVLIFLRLTLFR